MAGRARPTNPRAIFEPRDEAIGSCEWMLHATQALVESVATRRAPALLTVGAEWPHRLRRAPSPSVWPSDRHPMYEVAHLGEGECALVIDGVPYRLRAGDVALIPPGRVHYETPLAVGGAYRLHWIQISPPFASLFASDYLSGGEFRVSRHVSVPIDAEPEILLRRIQAEIERREPLSEWVTRGYLLTFLGRIYRLLHQAQQSEARAGAWLRSNDPIVQNAVRYVIGRYHDPTLSVADVARQVMLSPNYFNVYFRRATGCPPYRFLLQFRLERAQSLLAESDRPIAAIAEAVGFTSPYHFSRTFKQHVGQAPTEYRRQQTGCDRPLA